MELKQPTYKGNKRIANLIVLDGIKVALSFQVCYAMSFFCAQYHIIQFPSDGQKVLDGLLYQILVEQVFDSIDTFFLISGFMQTLIFM